MLANHSDHDSLEHAEAVGFYSIVGMIAGLVATLDDEFGFETDVQHLTVYGRCRDCRGGARTPHRKATAT